MSEMFFGAGTVRPGVQPEIRCPERTDGVVHITAYPVFPGIELRYNDVHASWASPSPYTVSRYTSQSLAGAKTRRTRV